MTWENRLTQANGALYAYGPDNLRVWQGQVGGGLDEVDFFGADGKRMGAYQPSVQGVSVVFTPKYNNKILAV